MSKEEYIECVDAVKDFIKQQQEKLITLKNQYIEDNKFCEIGQKVKIQLASDRIIEGKVNSFGIFPDKNVYVNSYINDKNKTIYITIPYKRIKLV
jgi:hypothetical protein